MAVKKGDKVTVDYEGKFEDGAVFDSSKHGDHSHPLVVVVGSGQVIKGFGDALVGMNEGEEKEVALNPEEAYGEHKPELKKEMPKSAVGGIPEGKKLEAGMMLLLGTPDGHQVPIKIDEVKDESMVVDLNHPLAGKKLIFKIKVVRIENS